MEYEKIEKTSAVPEASSMIETFRAIGYKLETAVADIVDNSISAGARNVYINRIWRGGQSMITISDDGLGMNGQEIIEALRPGSQSPLDERDESDLGRFGLGLKTASFSQCRKLSVLSRKNGFSPIFWSWDLDYVAMSRKWELIKWMPEEFEHDLDDKQSGTVVVWSEMDRILPSSTSPDNESAKMKFSAFLNRVRRHLSMTYHRFMEDGSLKIYWCGHELEPWNPFCVSEAKTQEQPTEYLPGNVRVKGYVLPHKDGFSSVEAYNKAEGINGWPSQQGFYVYRGKRLLLAGDWLGLFRKEEHYKLVRILIDLPNTLDVDWKIDIMKSRATPPNNCRDQLEAYAKSVRAKGAEVYRHRGKILKQKAGREFQPLWLEKKKDNKWSFVINRKHLLIRNLRELAKTEPEKAIDTLLRFIEEGIPTRTIYINEAKGEDSQAEPFSTIESQTIRTMLRTIYDNLLSQGMNSVQAKGYLKVNEPFNNYEDLIDEL
ncbi:MAG: ATP-binding protein [Prevotella sp.]|jgi:hypothetical protein|nr:ATP-binding protein [Prevotella sp.]